MSLLGNLSRIVSAPVKIVDKVLVEPLADAADAVVDEFGSDR